MEKISFHLAKKEGEVTVRYRLRKGDDVVQICHRSDIRCDVKDLAKLNTDGTPKDRVRVYDFSLSEKLKKEYQIMLAAYEKMCKEGMDITSEVFEREISAIKNPVVAARVDTPNIVARFRKYADGALSAGIIGEARHKHIIVVSEKLERFLIIKGISDIVFLTILFIALCIPCIKIDNSGFTKENRVLAEKPQILINNKKINDMYGRQFDDYIKDRFFLREFLIKTFYYTIGDINDILFVNRVTYNKKTKRMLLHYQHYSIELERCSLWKVIPKLNILNKFFEEKNIKLYILLTPDLEAVTDELSPYRLKNAKRREAEFIQKLKINSAAPMVYPYEAILEEAKTNPVTFRSDIHWTENSAFIGYKELMKVIVKDFPQVKILSENDFNIVKNKKVRSDWERTYNYGGLIEDTFPYCKNCRKELFDTDYLYYYAKKQNLLKTKVTDVPFLRMKDFYYPEGADLKVLLIGTSGNENLNEFLPYTFKNLKYIRIREVKNIKTDDEFKIMKYYEKEIMNYSPDIVIFSFFVGDLFQIKKIFRYD